MFITNIEITMIKTSKNVVKFDHNQSVVVATVMIRITMTESNLWTLTVPTGAVKDQQLFAVEPAIVSIDPRKITFGSMHKKKEEPV